MFKPRIEVKVKRRIASMNNTSKDVFDNVCVLLSVINNPRKKTEKIGIIWIVPILLLVSLCVTRGIAIRTVITIRYIDSANSE